jgi:HK97 family phage major capsid protein
MSYKLQLQEANTRLSVQMNAIVEKAKAENNRGLTSAERESFHALETDYTANEESIKLADRSAAISNDLRKEEPDKVISIIEGAATKGKREADPKHAKAFSGFLRNGIEGLPAEDRQVMQSKFMNAAQSTGTGAAGGYLVPTGFSDQLEQALKWFGGMVGNIDTFDTETGAPLPWPTVNDTANAGSIIGQNVQVTNVALAFSQVTFNSFIFSSNSVLVPLAMMQDSYFDLDAYIASALGVRLARILNTKLTVGVGTTEPEGIVTAAVAAGNTVVAATGGSTTVSYNNLVDLEHSVDPAYRPKSKYMFHDYTLKALKKLVDSANRPLWQPALTASFGQGAEPSILDHPYVINNDMPQMAANADSILFGDLTKYKMRRVAGGITVMRLVERYADYLQVGFQAFLRADGNLLDAGTHPVAVFVNSAT